VPGDMKNNY